MKWMEDELMENLLWLAKLEIVLLLEKKMLERLLFVDSLTETEKLKKKMSVEEQRKQQMLIERKIKTLSLVNLSEEQWEGQRSNIMLKELRFFHRLEY